MSNGATGLATNLLLVPGQHNVDEVMMPKAWDPIALLALMQDANQTRSNVMLAECGERGVVAAEFEEAKKPCTKFTCLPGFEWLCGNPAPAAVDATAGKENDLVDDSCSDGIFVDDVSTEADSSDDAGYYRIDSNPEFGSDHHNESAPADGPEPAAAHRRRYRKVPSLCNVTKHPARDLTLRFCVINSPRTEKCKPHQRFAAVAGNLPQSTVDIFHLEHLYFSETHLRSGKGKKQWKVASRKLSETTKKFEPTKRSTALDRVVGRQMNADQMIEVGVSH